MDKEIKRNLADKYDLKNKKLKIAYLKDTQINFNQHLEYN